MLGRKTKSGMTLVELMLSASIFALIAGMATTSFVGFVRMTRTTMANVELPLRARQLRDKLLFHAAPAHDNFCYPGLLCCEDMNVDTVALNGRGTAVKKGIDGESLGTHQVRVRLENSENQDSGPFFFNDGDRNDEKWLLPGNVYLQKGVRWQDVVDADDLTSNRRLYLTITLSSASTSGTPENIRTERVVLPVYKKYQIMQNNGF